MSCSAPCDDSTSTVPPMIPIQILKGAPSRNLRVGVPGGGVRFNQWSLPASAALEKIPLNPPSTRRGKYHSAKRPPSRNNPNCTASVQITALTPPTYV